MKKLISIEDFCAFSLIALLILLPLALAPTKQPTWWMKAISGGRPIDWLTLVVLVGQLFVFWKQAHISGVQADLMRGQLKATEKTARAALASLERPWLVIEDLSENEAQWLEGKDKLVAKFRIANYGKAPAFIKGISVIHFRGPDHHNGRPPFTLPEDVFDFPTPAELGRFIAQHGREPSIEVSAPLQPGFSQTYGGYSAEMRLARLENTSFVRDGMQSPENSMRLDIED